MPTPPAPDPAAVPPATPAPSGPSLTRLTARGMAWALLQTVGSQGVSLVSFLALGWLLSNDAFGLFALVTTISTLVALLKQFGIRAVLIRRAERMHLWCNPAVWMTLGLGLLATLALALAAPLGALIYGRSELVGLVLVFATGAIPSALCIVPGAILAARMRFKLLAIVDFGWTAGLSVLMVVFALLDFGAYSFVLPQPIVHTARLIVLWRAARPTVRRSPQTRRWRYLVGDSTLLSLTTLADWVTMQCDAVILALFYSESIVGLYFFGYRLSNRVILLFAASFRNVLLPTLSKLQHDPVRQARAFARVVESLATLAAPVCLLQALLAKPMFELLLPENKLPAADVVAVLSVAAFFRLISEPVQTVMTAQGRYKTLLRLSATLGIVFVLAIAVSASLGDYMTVAQAVSGFFVLAAIARLVVAMQPLTDRLRVTLRCLVQPVALALIALGASLAIETLEIVRDNLALRILAAVVIVTMVHAIGWWALRPQPVVQALEQVRLRLRRGGAA